MPQSRLTNPLMVGDNGGNTQAATISDSYNNPVAIGMVRIPLTGQAIVKYILPTYAVVLDGWLDIGTVWASGAVNVGTTSNGTELMTYATLTATGRVRPTLTAAQITASKAASLGAGQVSVFVSPSSSAGAGVGELVLLVGYANFKSPD